MFNGSLLMCHKFPSAQFPQLIYTDVYFRHKYELILITAMLHKYMIEFYVLPPGVATEMLREQEREEAAVSGRQRPVKGRKKKSGARK